MPALPGLSGLVGFGAQAKSFLLHSATTNANTTSITVPATTLAGDIAVLVDYAARTAATAPTLVTPSGFVNRVDAPVGNTIRNSRLAISTKKFVGGEQGTSLSCMNGDNEVRFLLIFRPDFSIATDTPGGWVSGGSRADPASQTIVATGNAGPMVLIGALGAYDSSPTSFGTASPAFQRLDWNNAGGGAAGLLVGHTIYSSSGTPVNHLIDAADLGESTTLAGGFLKFT